MAQEQSKPFDLAQKQAEMRDIMERMHACLIEVPPGWEVADIPGLTEAIDAFVSKWTEYLSKAHEAGYESDVNHFFIDWVRNLASLILTVDESCLFDAEGREQVLLTMLNTADFVIKTHPLEIVELPEP